MKSRGRRSGGSRRGARTEDDRTVLDALKPRWQPKQAASEPTAHVLPKGQRPHAAEHGEDCVIDKGQRSKEMESEGDRGRVDG